MRAFQVTYLIRNLATLTRVGLLVPNSDGSRQVVASDDHWRAATGPILASDLYDGETYDARLELPGWDAPGFDELAQVPTYARPTAQTSFDPLPHTPRGLVAVIVPLADADHALPFQ